jgi:hypothetical protein
MKTFKLTCTVTVSAYTEVRANSLDEALTKARKREVVLGGVGSGVSDEDSWVIEEADGAPRDITYRD